MWIQRLRIRDFRCIAIGDLEPSPGLNVLLGGNGAGKTSVLEAIAVGSSGRSFRASRAEDLVRTDGNMQLVLDVVSEHRVSRLGLARSEQRWLARVDGQPARGFAEMASRLAVEVFEPNSHEIVSGGSENRRRFLDWGVFHVEPAFGGAWARYQRALKQRNAMLRSGTASAVSLEPWNLEMASAGSEITALREQFIDRYSPIVANHAADLAAELGEPEVRFKRGWTAGDLYPALLQSLERDLAMGHSTRGPHRSDWSLHFRQIGSRERWSRGQQKIAVFILCRAMLDTYAIQRGEPAVACLDDVFSELDPQHQLQCLQSLETAKAQVWITGTEASKALDAWQGPQKWFHVEQGVITPVHRHTL